jgi:hypothetical protein
MPPPPPGVYWRPVRAKNITNKPRINEDPKDAMLREFQDEIQKLKAALAVGIAASWGHCYCWYFGKGAFEGLY